MIPRSWLDFLWSDTDLYLWGSCTVAVALAALEIAVVIARERTILGHLGWRSPDEPTPPAGDRSAARDGTHGN